jgi:hypothetical protein
MRKRTVVLAFAAGLLGGIASRYVTPEMVHADSIPREVRAKSFVLVNEQGTLLGTFTEEAGRPSLKLSTPAATRSGRSAVK